MTNDIFISQFETLPLQIQRELTNYMEFLINKYNITTVKKQKPQKKVS